MYEVTADNCAHSVCVLIHRRQLCSVCVNTQQTAVHTVYCEVTANSCAHSVCVNTQQTAVHTVRVNTPQAAVHTVCVYVCVHV